MNGAQVSAAIDRFLEWDLKRTNALAHEANAQHLEESARPKCGNCQLWMTRQCPQERNVNGWNKGPSCEGFACGKFAEKTGAYSPQRWREEAAIERAKAAAIFDEIRNDGVSELRRALSS